MRTVLAFVALAASTCNTVAGSQSGEIAFETGSEEVDAGVGSDSDTDTEPVPSASETR